GKVGHDATVDPEESYTAELTVGLSPAISGRYVIVQTAGTTLPGDQFQGSHRRSVASYVTPAPAADLRVTEVVTQPESFSGEKTTVSWTVKNFGSTAWESTRYWTDAVYLSRDPTFIPTRATLLGTVGHSNNTPLGADQSYTQTREFTLPRGIGG